MVSSAARAAAWRLRNPERAKFQCHRSAAKHRGVPFTLTYEEWLAIWGDLLEHRGQGPGKYHMARHGDQGGYEVGNVSIVLGAANLADGQRGRIKPPEARAKISAALKANPPRPWLGKHLSEEHKRAISETKRGLR